jgi:hypothetical protein
MKMDFLIDYQMWLKKVKEGEDFFIISESPYI